jgi:tRNA 5-methylaminomethyl-2-thiouridine biosynthesis bifunctional protein
MLNALSPYPALRFPTLNPEPRQALVIGAGLAGAATCAALTRKGWQVTLLDAAAGPAQAASALPVGMLSPHVTRSPTPLSRLCDLGVAATRAELRRLVPQGAGWQTCEVDNLQHDPGRWPATLVRPGALVQAWLNESRHTAALRTLWNARVHALARRTSSSGETIWQALDPHKQTLAEAPNVVVAAAFGGHGLLAPDWVSGEDWPLRPVKGQMSLGALSDKPLAERPLRQSGVFVPSYEDTGLPPNWPSRIWAMGSTYERGDNSTHTTPESHRRNAESLAAMLPAAANAMLEAEACGALLGWAQVRCASLDRLPLAGAVPDATALNALMGSAGSRRGRVMLSDVPRLPGLFTLSALGSRGLTLALPMAQLLVQTMSGEASALEADLQRAVDPARFAWRLARKQPAASAR